MSEPIKEGDLVMVVRGHQCLFNRMAGKPFRAVLTTGRSCGCSVCAPSAKIYTAGPAVVWPGELSTAFIPVEYLKRIPPLSELGDVKQDEEITA